MKTRAGVILPPTAGLLVDVSDRVVRQLGIVASITAPIDVSDRTGRLVGKVNQGDPNVGAFAWPMQLVRPSGTSLDPLNFGGALLHVTATGLVNTQVTLTLPAVAGQFHYLTSIELVKLYNALGVAAGAGNIITSTNLPGNPAWTTEQLASPAGTAVRVIDYRANTVIRSAVTNTPTTLVAPAQLQTIWRFNVSYFTAA